MLRVFWGASKLSRSLVLLGSFGGTSVQVEDRNRVWGLRVGLTGRGGGEAGGGFRLQRLQRP